MCLSARAGDASLFLQATVAGSRADGPAHGTQAGELSQEAVGRAKWASWNQVEMQPRAMFWLAHVASDRCYSPLLFFKHRLNAVCSHTFSGFLGTLWKLKCTETLKPQYSAKSSFPFCQWFPPQCLGNSCWLYRPLPLSPESPLHMGGLKVSTFSGSKLCHQSALQ